MTTKSAKKPFSKKSQTKETSQPEENTDDELCPLFGICDAKKEEERSSKL